MLSFISSSGSIKDASNPYGDYKGSHFSNFVPLIFSYVGKDNIKKLALISREAAEAKETVIVLKPLLNQFISVTALHPIIFEYLFSCAIYRIELINNQFKQVMDAVLEKLNSENSTKEFKQDRMQELFDWVIKQNFRDYCHLAKYLLEDASLGIDVNCRKNYNNAPLVVVNSKQWALFLISNGAKVDLRVHDFGIVSPTISEFALVSRQCEGVFEAMLESKAASIDRTYTFQPAHRSCYNNVSLFYYFAQNINPYHLNKTILQRTNNLLNAGADATTAVGTKRGRHLTFWNRKVESPLEFMRQSKEKDKFEDIITLVSVHWLVNTFKNNNGMPFPLLQLIVSYIPFLIPRYYHTLESMESTHRATLQLNEDASVELKWEDYHIRVCF